MKTRIAAALLAVICGPLAAAPASAPSDMQGQALERWKKMTPEEQAAARAKAKARYDAMTPEEREAVRAKAKARYDSMTPEQQAAARKRFTEQHPQAAGRLDARRSASAPASSPTP